MTEDDPPKIELLPYQEAWLRDRSPLKVTLAELQRRRADGPLPGKSALSPVKLMQLLPAMTLLSGLEQLDHRFEVAVASLALALQVSARELLVELETAAKHDFQLTAERLELWTEAALRGEIGLTEILIAIEGDGLRGKSGYTVVDEPPEWSDRFRQEYQCEFAGPEPSGVIVESSPPCVGHRSGISRQRKSTFAQRARRLMR